MICVNITLLLKGLETQTVGLDLRLVGLDLGLEGKDLRLTCDLQNNDLVPPLVCSTCFVKCFRETNLISNLV